MKKKYSFPKTKPTKYIYIKNDFYLPYYCNYELKEATEISSIIIFIHGSDRNPEKIFLEYIAKNNILLFLPQFLTEEDKKNLKIEKKILLFDLEGWKIGNCGPDIGGGMSSFSVFDFLIEKFNLLFANLKNIYFCGHSGGAQFLNRWCIGTKIVEKCNWVFLLLNAGSYLFFDENVNYKYGLKNLNCYMQQKKIADMINQYRNKNVYYIIGEKDINVNKTSMDKSDLANKQGLTRVDRAKNYYNHLKLLYNNDFNHKLIFVPGVGHSGKSMRKSKIVKDLLTKELLTI